MRLSETLNPSSRVRHRRWLFLGIIVVVVVGAASGGAIGALKGDESRPTFGLMPGDVDGDGVVSDHGAERIPSLISAVTDDGKPGYVRFGDLNSNAPTSPAEAVRRQSKLSVLTVYAADGQTVIGRLTESDGPVIESKDGTALTP